MVFSWATITALKQDHYVEYDSQAETEKTIKAVDKAFIIIKYRSESGSLDLTSAYGDSRGDSH